MAGGGCKVIPIVPVRGICPRGGDGQKALQGRGGGLGAQMKTFWVLTCALQVLGVGIQQGLTLPPAAGRGAWSLLDSGRKMPGWLTCRDRCEEELGCRRHDAAQLGRVRLDPARTLR